MLKRKMVEVAVLVVVAVTFLAAYGNSAPLDFRGNPDLVFRVPITHENSGFLFSKFNKFLSARDMQGLYDYKREGTLAFDKEIPLAQFFKPGVITNFLSRKNISTLNLHIELDNLGISAESYTIQNRFPEAFDYSYALFDGIVKAKNVRATAEKIRIRIQVPAPAGQQGYVDFMVANWNNPVIGLPTTEDVQLGVSFMPEITDKMRFSINSFNTDALVESLRVNTNSYAMDFSFDIETTPPQAIARIGDRVSVLYPDSSRLQSDIESGRFDPRAFCREKYGISDREFRNIKMVYVSAKDLVEEKKPFVRTVFFNKITEVLADEQNIVGLVRDALRDYEFPSQIWFKEPSMSYFMKLKSAIPLDSSGDLVAQVDGALCRPSESADIRSANNCADDQFRKRPVRDLTAADTEFSEKYMGRLSNYAMVASFSENYINRLLSRLVLHDPEIDQLMASKSIKFNYDNPNSVFVLMNRVGSTLSVYVDMLVDAKSGKLSWWDRFLIWLGFGRQKWIRIPVGVTVAVAYNSVAGIPQMVFRPVSVETDKEFIRVGNKALGLRSDVQDTWKIKQGIIISAIQGIMTKTMNTMAPHILQFPSLKDLDINTGQIVFDGHGRGYFMFRRKPVAPPVPVQPPL